MNNHYISSFVRIQHNRIYRDGNLVFEKDANLNLKAFLKEAYMFLETTYPKFHKMDAMCKLGILGSEILQQKNVFKNNMALVFSNAASSLETDRRHQDSLESFPSPATFVYTLPNIVLGEISIKYNIQSENIFFVSETFDAQLLYDYTAAIMADENIDQALLGWIDVDKDSYNAFLCVISRSGKTPFSAEHLQKTYAHTYE